MKNFALTAAGIVALASLPSAGQAQVQMPGWFGSVDGNYVIDTTGKGSSEFSGPGFGHRVPGGGWGANGLLGYGFGGGWDIAATGNYMDLAHGKADAGSNPPYAARITDMKIWGGGVQLGYSMKGAGYNVRPFLGVSYQRWDSEFHDFIGTPFSTDVRAWGVGPKLGFDAAVTLSGPLSLLVGADVAVLFGHIKDSKNANWLADPGLNGSDNRTFFTAAARVALDWEISPLVHLAAGYKAEWLDGVNYRSLDPNDGGPGGAPSGRAHMLMHGPFVRLAYNIGVGAAPVVAPMAPQPQAVLAKTYIVFFDWDRSTLTPDALKTIADAAAASKTGGVQRVNVTGHADRSGSDQYNMALSLRRAGAVKDQLVRNGVPANQIVVVGRGESQPLVPTADGVREPQNRRVEIVLN